VHLVFDALFAARNRTPLIRIIGIGSPFGDDAAGLEVANLLSESPPPNCEIIAADRPGASLVEMLDGADAAILIDAARSGATPGTLHEFGFDELERCAAARLVSSHDLGVAAAVELAHKLGRAPARGIILAVEIAPAARQQIGGLSAAAREAVERASTRVRQLARELNEKRQRPPL
jgi:hydrogenase maturation protease